ncbi:MAG: hypothetical protein E7315_01035 [Clostridiales bacterium]|nr:hypothetical protein [Clostridiales bacterium]
MVLKTIILILSSLFISTVQGIFVPRLFSHSEFFSMFIPNAVFAFVFLCGALGGYLKGFYAGMLSGLLYGMLYSQGLFLSIIAYSLVGVIAGIIFKFLTRHIVFCLICTFLGSVIFTAIQSFIVSFSFESFSYDFYNMLIILTTSFSTTISMVILYYPVLWMTTPQRILPMNE